jgi:uncharacterized membrane protein YgdD (TMEM256/DUF423 family)
MPGMVSGWVAVGALLAAVGVALGAFGAHGLKARVAPELLAVFETGVRYHLIHALGLFVVAAAAARWPGVWVSAAGWLFTAGIVLFAGSLYLLVLTGARWLGAITPLGGVCFILGWLALAAAAVLSRSLASP